MQKQRDTRLLKVMLSFLMNGMTMIIRDPSGYIRKQDSLKSQEKMARLSCGKRCDLFRLQARKLREMRK